MMIRFLRIAAILSLMTSFVVVVAASAAIPTTRRAPWCIPRGGSDSSYAGRLEAVKTSVLEAANDSVRKKKKSII